MACLIAAPCSGSGKTLLSLCLTALVRQRGASIQTFKVGPDYLDPQLLSLASGRPCRNLDRLLCGQGWVQRSFPWWGARADHCLVEGVMGLFDGRGPGLEGSSAELARQLDLPVVLVVEASRQAGSLAALVGGFRDHLPGLEVAGVVLNSVSTERHRALLSEALAGIAMPLLGVLPRHPSLSLPSRHLGLLPAHELDDLEGRLSAWAALAERHLDLGRLLPLLAPPPRPGGPLEPSQDPIRWCLEQAAPQTKPKTTPGPAPAGLAPSGALPAAPPAAVHLAIADDAAFHFRYPEGSELLACLGITLIPWQPLADQPLPAGCQGLILPGGYPELHAADLAASRRSLAELRRAAAAGLPIYAECGGLLLLGEQLVDDHGVAHAMAGLLPFRARRGALQLGYRQASPLQDGLVIRRREPLCGHEFHRWELEPTGLGRPPEPSGGRAEGPAAPLWQIEGWGWPQRQEGWGRPHLHASWLHLHWGGCAQICHRLHAAAARARPLAAHAAT